MPYISDPDHISVSACSCNANGTFACVYENLGLGQGYTPSFVPLCDLREAYWCPQIERGECNYIGSSVVIYYSDRYVSTGYEWGAMNFSGTEIMEIENEYQPLYVESSIGTLLFFYLRHVLPNGVSTYELRNAFFEAYPRFPSMDRMNDYCRGEWVPHDENCFGTEQEAILAAEDSTDNCTLGAGIGYYSPRFTEKNGWCAVGNCEGGEFYSSAAESLSSSSSSSEGSSSSSSLCDKHPLANVPDNPNRACFNTNGKCYKCNSERGSACANDWLWIYDFNSSNVGHWYTEVDCLTGAEKTTDEGIGVCSSHPLKKVPSDPQNACFASGGVCYQCNSERGSACANDWLWIYDFNSSNVGWWYEQVDCFNPNGEDHDGQCPDGSVLQKRASNSREDSKEAYVDYTNELLNTQKYYDVLGRKAKKTLKRKKALYQRNTELQTVTDINLWGEETSVYLKGSSIECGNNSKGKWICEDISGKSALKKSDGSDCGILGKHYGIVENGSRTGGITCVKTAFSIPDAELSGIQIGQCNDGSRLLNVSFTLTSAPSILVRNEPFSVLADYVFSDGYIATEEDEKAMHYHELGHVKYNECIEFPTMTESYSFDCICESKLPEIRTVFEDAIKVRDRSLVKEAEELFHQKYGTSGYAKIYTCPQN